MEESSTSQTADAAIEHVQFSPAERPSELVDKSTASAAQDQSVAERYAARREEVQIGNELVRNEDVLAEPGLHKLESLEGRRWRDDLAAEALRAGNAGEHQKAHDQNQQDEEELAKQFHGRYLLGKRVFKGPN